MRRTEGITTTKPTFTVLPNCSARSKEGFYVRLGSFSGFKALRRKWEIEQMWKHHTQRAIAKEILK